MFARLLHTACAEPEWYDWAAVNGGALPLFRSVARRPDGTVLLAMADGVTRTVLLRVLQFLYTGHCAIRDAKDSVAETMEAAELFELEFLCGGLSLLGDCAR